MALSLCASGPKLDPRILNVFVLASVQMVLDLVSRIPHILRTVQLILDYQNWFIGKIFRSRSI